MEPQLEDGKSSRWWPCLPRPISEFFRKLKKVAKDDPRRVIHSFKVGLGLTLVSTFYYVDPVFKGLGESVMWAVLTVVLVMEFTVGAAISKGLNRAGATLLGGALGLGAHYLAILFGDKGEPIVLGVLVFMVVAVGTYARFLPSLKARYDYGVMIFILTFSLVAVTSYREEEKIIVMARERLSTISIGVAISFFTSILVFPAWAGEDLHRATASNLQKLASFLQGFEEALEAKKPCLDSHKSVLNSKASEDMLHNFTRWEPIHGKFRFRHPWNLYLKIGEQTRRCAYIMEALNIYMANSTQRSYNKNSLEACVHLSSALRKAFGEVASAVKSMTKPSPMLNHNMATASLASLQAKKSLIENTVDQKEILHVVTILSFLMEMTGCAQEVVNSVEELVRRTVVRKTSLKQLPAQAKDVERHQQQPNHGQDPNQNSLRSMSKLNHTIVEMQSTDGGILSRRELDKDQVAILDTQKSILNAARIQVARRSSFSPKIQI